MLNILAAYVWNALFEGFKMGEGVFAILVHPDKKKILIKQRGTVTSEGKPVSYGGCWDLPGGRKEDGETNWSCLSREVLEETGLDVSNNKKHYIDIPLFLGNEQRQTVDKASCFVVFLDEEPTALTTSNESTAFAWVGKDDIAQNERTIVCGKDNWTPGRTPLMMAFGLALLEKDVSNWAEGNSEGIEKFYFELIPSAEPRTEEGFRMTPDAYECIVRENGNGTKTIDRIPHPSIHEGKLLRFC